MGLNINIFKGRVHPKDLTELQLGGSIGCALKRDDQDIVQITKGVYFQRRMYMVRDVLVKVLNNGSTAEYHLLTPSRVSGIIDEATRVAARLSVSPDDTYFDEVQPLLDLASCMREIQRDEGDELYFAIWG